MTALDLFRSGMDTVQIAQRLNITEAAASNLVWKLRCREHNLASIYMPGPARQFPGRPLKSKWFIDPSSVRIKAAGC